MNEFIYIVGINGVGKSILSSKMAERLSLRYISSSKMLKDACRVKHSYELEKFDQALLIKLYTKAFLQLLKEAKKPVILDTHSVVFMANGKEDYTQPTAFYPYSKGIINIVATPSEILQRIESDNINGLKKRLNDLKIKDVAIMIKKSSEAAKRMALEGGFPYKQLNNPHPLTELNFNFLQNIIKQLIRK